MRKLELTPRVLEKDGKKMFVVLPYEQFTELAERLEELEDLCDLREAKLEAVGEDYLSWESVKEELAIGTGDAQNIKVTSQSFYIGKYEVTQAQWELG